MSAGTATPPSAAMVGTAPIATEVKDFVTELLDIQVRDNYGSTEAGMVLHDGVIARPPVIEYKLDDVPELDDTSDLTMVAVLDGFLDAGIRWRRTSESVAG